MLIPRVVCLCVKRSFVVDKRIKLVLGVRLYTEDSHFLLNIWRRGICVRGSDSLEFYAGLQQTE